MTRPATNHTAPRVRYRSPPRDPSPCRTQIWPSDGRGHPWLALHVKSAASPSDSPTRGVAPIGTVRSSTWRDPQSVDRALGSLGAGRLKGASGSGLERDEQLITGFAEWKRRRSRGTMRKWALSSALLLLFLLTTLPDPGKSLPLEAFVFLSPDFFLFYLILRHYGEFT